MNPNSEHQLWSAWTFRVFDAGRLVPRADVETNAARWLNKGFGSVGAIQCSRTRNGWLIRARVEGAPAHDPAYLQRVCSEFQTRFVAQGWGPMATSRVEVRILAGHVQDGKPPSQWIDAPTIKLGVLKHGRI